MTSALGDLRSFFHQALTIERRIVGEDPPTTDWPTVKVELMAVLESQTETAGKRGEDVIAPDYLDRRFLQALVGDQKFADFERPGWKEDWAAGRLSDEVSLRPSSDLQQAMLEDPAKGVLDRLQHVLDRNDPNQVSLVETYLGALALGVPGALASSVAADDCNPTGCDSSGCDSSGCDSRGCDSGGCDDQGEQRRLRKQQERVDHLRKSSLAFLRRHRDDLTTPGPLFPEAYQRTTEGDSDSRLPVGKLWTWASIVATVVFLMLSWWVWQDSTEAARDGAQTILELFADRSP